MSDVVLSLSQMSGPPEGKEAFDAWLQMDSALAFLRDNAEQDEFVVYPSNRSTFVHAILVPASLVSPPNTDDLMSWNGSADSSWGIDARFSQPPSVWISPPLDHTGSDTLNRGEQLVFLRYFEGRPGKKSYYEILQKFTQVFDLHFIDVRNAYCRLDKHGDLEDVIRIVEISGRGEHLGENVLTVNRDVLDEYLVLTNSVIVRTFDFTRCRPSDFSGWVSIHQANYETEGEIFYRSHVEPGYASYLRGFQLVRSAATNEAILRRFDHRAESDEKEYASFIAFDWKNRVIREISSAPGHTANYFTKSDLPFEVTPAFFKPEVLIKYKSDTEKYRLAGRSISCRGAWSLQTYDINDAGQVHTYLVYLRSLPYEEQLYWKSYNEPPRGPISQRAFTTDFEGQYYTEYDSLESLKNLIGDLHRKQVPWWTLRSEKLREQLHYPVTSSSDEWATEILNLDQLVVEGFETKWLRSKAQSLGRALEVSFASLKLVEECLAGMRFEADDAKRLMAPLREAHDLRSKVKGHAPGKDSSAIKKQILKDHGGYKEHFRDLCQRCDESMRAIAEAMVSTK